MQYLLDRPDLVLDGVIEHLYITVVAVVAATVIGVFLGVLVTRMRALYDPVMTVSGIIYTVPSLAMFVLMIPILGIGFKSAVVALVLYSLLILIRNTAVGIDGVDENIIEAAQGMGMTPLSILLRIELPLAMPVVFAGIRIAAVSAISLGTIAAFIGAGGIGDLIFEGISSQRDDKIIAGAFAASALAIGTEILLRQIEKGSSPGITGEFKTLGEYAADMWSAIWRRPDLIALVGAVLLLVGYSSVTWVQPYAEVEVVAENPANEEVLAENNLLAFTGWDLAQVGSNAPVTRSLQILPILGLIVGVIGLWNVFRGPGGRASAEVLLLCGLVAAFPLLHFYLELDRAVGELGSYSQLFRVIHSQTNALIDGRVPITPDSLSAENGFIMSVVGVGLIVGGALLKSITFRRRGLQIQQAEEQQLQQAEELAA